MNINEETWGSLSDYLNTDLSCVSDVTTKSRPCGDFNLA